jgi:cytochrome b
MNQEKQLREDQAKCEDCLSRDQAARLYTHAMHEDGMFHARFHAFLIIQTVLLTATSVVRSGSPSAPIVGYAIPIAALILSLTWGYVQDRQKRKLDLLIHRLERFLPEFARTRKWTRPPRCCPSATTLLTYVVPLSFVVLWSVIAGSSFFSG